MITVPVKISMRAETLSVTSDTGRAGSNHRGARKMNEGVPDINGYPRLYVIVQRINMNTRCAWYEKTTTRKRARWRRGVVKILPTREHKLERGEMYVFVQWLQERH